MPESHRFGRYELRPAERVLLVDGQPAALGPRAVDLLVALVERRKGVVSKGELLQVVWPGAAVSESNLHMQISALRGLLGGQAIATIPGRGYQFTLRPDGIDGQASGTALNGAVRPTSSPAARAPNPSPAAPTSASAPTALPALPPEPSNTLPAMIKLAVILSSDVVGYSRLMGEDDRATFESIVATRSVMAEQITCHGGRVVDAKGDALLGEFPSAIESVRCAVTIQAELAQRNAALPETRRMVLRIGLNVGDVIEQDAALYGEGVNVAARLQTLGEPGGVCISGSIHDQVDGKLPLAFRFAGEQTVKNIAKPVRAYHVGAHVPAGASPAPTPQPLVKPQPIEYCFTGLAKFELHPDQRLLLADAEPAKLGARAFDVLLALIERHERMVSKNELLDLVWPGVVVEEGNLQTQVSNLRKLLGPQVIETIPGRGYRFMAALEGVPAQAQVAPTRIAPAAAQATAPTTAPEFKTNLPETLPPLFGREDDLAALGSLITQHRLTSVIAAGGMGKSRLAVQLLHERRSAYEHGVCLVELAGLSDPQLVVSTIAGALGIQTGTGDALQGLVASLKGLTLLVALDNAEHLIDEVARVVQHLIDGAPQLKLLVTSQVPLKCAKERVYRLGSLAAPEGTVPVDEALSFGAVALFVDCAQAADRHFELTSTNVSTVIDVCHHLDGMALAIELAAARVSLLGLPKLAATLNERLRVLTSGSRSAPQRQKTLRAALEWSHGLLSPAEQAVFRRLGVFAGGFALEMAQKVVADEAGEPPLDEWAVLDTLGALVDRSLVMADAGERPRYRLLESPRAYALERLVAAKEEATCQRRHAQAVLTHFKAVEADCWGGRIGMDAAIALLEADLDNAREAMGWALKHDAYTAVALASPLNYALWNNPPNERAAMWEATAERMTDDLPDPIRAAWALGCSRFWAGGKPRTRWFRTAIDLYRRIEDRIGLYRALSSLCIFDASDTPSSARQALEELREVEEPRWPPTVKYEGAQAEFRFHFCQREFDAAQRALQRMLGLAEEGGSSTRVIYTGRQMADCAILAGRVDEAVLLGLEVERQSSKTRRPFLLALSRIGLVCAYLAQGDLQKAHAMAETAWPLAKQFWILDDLADHVALLTAIEGRAHDSAKLRGFVDARHANSGQVREFPEARAVERAERLARAQLGDAEFELLRAEGATLCEDEIAALAIRRIDA